VHVLPDQAGRPRDPRHRLLRERLPHERLHFGDLNDPYSVPNVYLAQRRKEAGGNLPTFRLLDELGTQPNIIYIGTPPSKDAELVDTGFFSLEDWGLTDDRKATLEGPKPWFDRTKGKAEA
jgi:hypothetical protein